MASNPGNDPKAQPPIERVPFATIERAYERWVIDKWVAVTIAIFFSALVIFLAFVFAPDDLVFDIPQVLYAVGTLMVAAGISVIILGALTLEARAMIRDMAMYGKPDDATSGQKNLTDDVLGSKEEGGGQGTVARGGSIAFTQILDAATNLPTPRFLIIFGIVAMLLGAGLDGKWTMPNISFEMEQAASTPSAGASANGDAANDATAPDAEDAAADDASNDGNSPPPGDEDDGPGGTSGGDGT